MHVQIKYQIIDGAKTQVNTTDNVFTAVHFIDDMQKRWPNMLYQIAIFTAVADMVIAGNTRKTL